MGGGVLFGWIAVDFGFVGVGGEVEDLGACGLFWVQGVWIELLL